MPDLEKVINGLERCLKNTCPSVFSEEYRNCEYTMGLYCRKDKLLQDVLELLKEQEEQKRNPVIICPHCGKRVK